jgi:hypothetical protein
LERDFTSILCQQDRAAFAVPTNSASPLNGTGIFGTPGISLVGNSYIETITTDPQQSYSRPLHFIGMGRFVELFTKCGTGWMTADTFFISSSSVNDATVGKSDILSVHIGPSRQSRSQNSRRKSDSTMLASLGQ